MPRPISALHSVFGWCALVTCQVHSVIRRLLVIAVVLMFAASCSQKARIDYRLGPGAGQSDRDAVVDKLLSHYRQWRGVPYKNGGVSRAGIDCSAFVVLAFRQNFGIELPRTTDELAVVGSPVVHGAIRPGDLLLFKTSWFTRHVGISVDQDRFIHASSSQGVVLSALDEPYWHQRLWQVRRVLSQ
ncbi:NlpC/P60 family protein [Desulfofustis glycolicus]|uniref:Lipoprotein Spr n=1 Tax=Desulfofustis glycolicus DSM 9705 TaxID=1121409 RepID=A0A1M5WCD3_9BACT|nr:NlpC/P60 family protein [Desulfofustis glycolicus]MCB2217098.1 C40 family peptidase [Desulfobulbaceae bacterium]SHH85131.1 lipoprotein Spr [Desulfofustis glycolicus DSM 9705]